MRGSLPSRVARPGPHSRLARFGALASVTLLVSLTASTAVALADDSSPAIPGGVSTTLASLPTSEPPTTSESPTTSEPPVTTDAPTTTEAPTTTTTEAPTTTDAPTTTTTAKPVDVPVPPTSVVNGHHPGFGSDCRRGDDRDDDDDDEDERGRQCSRPRAIEPLPPRTPVDPTPATTTPEPTTPGGNVTVEPPPGSDDDEPGADATAPGPDEPLPAVASDPGDSSGVVDPFAGISSDDGDDEFAIAAFGDTELSDGVDLALQGRIGEAPPFGERLWAALPFGLLVGVVLVGMAILAVRLTRDDLTAD